MTFAWFFFRDFSDFFLGGSVGQTIYREYIVFRGSNISCSLASAISVMAAQCGPLSNDVSRVARDSVCIGVFNTGA